MTEKGFNRVEVLILIGMIITIFIVAVFFVLKLQSDTRDARRRSDIDAISRALEAHFNRSDNENCDVPTDSYCHLKGQWFDNKRIPADPLTGIYFNLPKDGDKKYLICAKLENGGGNAQDNQAKPAFGQQASYYCQNSQQ